MLTVDVWPGLGVVQHRVPHLLLAVRPAFQYANTVICQISK
jgi:hypothetical protein